MEVQGAGLIQSQLEFVETQRALAAKTGRRSKFAGRERTRPDKRAIQEIITRGGKKSLGRRVVGRTIGVKTGTLKDTLTLKKLQKQRVSPNSITLEMIRLPYTDEFDEERPILDVNDQDKEEYNEIFRDFIAKQIVKFNDDKTKFIRQSRFVRVSPARGFLSGTGRFGRNVFVQFLPGGVATVLRGGAFMNVLR